ncbi:MAG: prepilin-type N-terminal cleavage/methylation domain-containing protein [Nitrospiraceae bacterium]|nr:prepilin-type N-terminal cleavage/methylation domain-containing protein [Nitrospiraceae bacterium]
MPVFTGMADSIGKEDGFTLIELLIALAISVFVLAGTTTLFAQLFAQFKQESRVSQTDIGSALGLQYMVKDIQSAGYGLPWDLNGAGYNEYVAGSCPNVTIDTDARNANDAPGNPPRAIVTPGAGIFGEDYLSIKSISVAVNDLGAGKSTTLRAGPTTMAWLDLNNNPVQAETPAATDWVVVLSFPPNAQNQPVPTLQTQGGAFSTQFNLHNLALFAPTDPSQTYMIYDVASAADASATGPQMPFNRADYFIANNSVPVFGAGKPTVPARCASNTGELVKAVVNQANGSFNYYPLMDCVAYMKVNFLRASGAVADANTIYFNDNTAALVQQDIKEVRVYILAQEGQREPSYTAPGTFYLGDCATPPVANPPICVPYNLNASQQNGYRWKVYTIVEKPFNLGAQ